MGGRFEETMMVEEFFEFLRKREGIRLAKEAGKPREEWTDDPILQQYKFTNVKREHDWTTQQLMKNFYEGHATVGRPTELLVNCTIARFFGLAGTVIEIGWCDGGIEATVARIEEVVARRYSRGDSVFTGAYIVPNCGDPRPKHEIVIDVVRDVHELGRDDWFTPGLPLQHAVLMLTKIKGFGSFMAKEVLLDFCLAGQWEPPDWETWTPVGPGARRGASRVANDGSLYPALNEKRALEIVKQLHSAYTQDIIERTLPLWPLGWVALDLCDIQFQLCEFDKYLRAVRKEGQPKSKYSPRQVK